jgi:translation initiation factor IF-2
MPAPGEAPGPSRPVRAGSRGRGAPRYEKNKEVALKGYSVPRFGGPQIPQGDVPITKTITVTEGISVKDLAEKLDVRGKDLIATLLMKGVMVTVNQSLDGELVKEVARQFGADATVISVEEQLENEAIEGLLEDTSNMVEVVRAPVVTIMGHVDHGKTSLLDAIRLTDVAAGEAGGITQHIGAYKVKITKPDSPAFGREIVFLDTPGHEAFTRMRARGAKITDIVVIVVAADDGVMPQTLEAIDHARAAKVPIIVAVNKIDKPEADPSRVMNQLAARGVQATSMGGDTEFVEVSAKKRLNLDQLEEMICLVADVNEQKATPERPAVGTVIEAKLDRGRGAVASILVQNGTLKTGDSYIVGNTFGKVRAMFNDRGQEIKEAGPSTPVEILGLESIPDAGDTFLVMADRDKAKGIAQYRKMKEREAQLAKSSRVSLEGLAEQAGGRQGPQPHPQGRCAGIGGSAGRFAAENVDREGSGKGTALGCWRDHGVGYLVGFGVECGCYRIQCSTGPQGYGSGGAGERRDPAALDYLRVAGPDYEGDVWTAGAGVQGKLCWPCDRYQRLQDHQGWPDCRLAGDRWSDQTRQPGARAA